MSKDTFPLLVPKVKNFSSDNNKGSGTLVQLLPHSSLFIFYEYVADITLIRRKQEVGTPPSYHQTLFAFIIVSPLRERNGGECLLGGQVWRKEEPIRQKRHFVLPGRRRWNIFFTSKNDSLTPPPPPPSLSLNLVVDFRWEKNIKRATM